MRTNKSPRGQLAATTANWKVDKFFICQIPVNINSLIKDCAIYIDDLKMKNFLKSFKFSQMSTYCQKHYPNDS